MNRVEGKVAIVSGAASGIGRASARALAAAGAKVMVSDIDEAGGAAVVAEIEADGGDAAFLGHDVTDEAAWQAVVAETEARWGSLHILVNNAGIGIACSVVEMSLEDWRRQTAINIDGVFLGTKHAIPAMRRSGGGSIVNISSVAGLQGSAFLAGYCATKGAVRLFTKAVALECAAAGDNIRVNSVHPGIIDTPIWTKILSGGLAGGANTLDPDAMSEAAVPLRRAGQAEDVADGVLFLASDAARYITGSELVIDGGLSIGRINRHLVVD